MENSGSDGAQTFTVGGTYAIVLNPLSHAVGYVTVAVHTASAAPPGAATIGRPAVTAALSTPGDTPSGRSITLAATSLQLTDFDFSRRQIRPPSDGTVGAGERPPEQGGD
jgi:hypothetical protein